MSISPIIFDERKLARFMNDRDDYIDVEGHTKKYNYFTPHKMAYAMWLRYYMYNDKFKDEERLDEAVRSTLITFCKDKASGFDEDVDYQKIKKIIECTKKRKIWSDIKVKISNNEWDQICSLENENARRFYFCCLVIAKFYREAMKDNRGEGFKEFTDLRYKIGTNSRIIAKYARIRLKEDRECISIWKELYNAGLASPYRYKRIKCKNILLKADIEINPEDVKMEIIPCDTMILYYIDQYQKENVPEDKWKTIKYCKNCNEPYDEGVSRNLCKICYLQKGRLQKSIPCSGGCGRILHVDIGSKQKYCDECKKEKDKKRKDYIYHVTKKCSECGNEFTASSKSKRDICDECYAKKRKKYKADKAKNGQEKSKK